MKGIAVWIGVLLVSVLTLLPQAVALVTAPQGTGSTLIRTTPTPPCVATVNEPASGILHVGATGDDVQFDYSVSYQDTRTAPATQAHHYFLLTVSYSQASGDQTEEYAVDTYGSASGGPIILSETVLDAQPGTTIVVSYTAELSIACSAGDSGSATFQIEI